MCDLCCFCRSCVTSSSTSKHLSIHLINRFHGSFLKDSLLINEMTLGTELELVCCLYVWKGREVFKQRFGGPSIWTRYLLLTTTAVVDKIMYFSHFFHGSVIYCCWKHIKNFVLWCNLCNLSKTILDLFHLLYKKDIIRMQPIWQNLSHSSGQGFNHLLLRYLKNIVCF